MDKLGLRRAAYCGLSIGGMVGQWLAINAPERITSLVVLCTAAHLPPPEPWLDRARTVRTARSAEVVADAVVARWFTEPWAAAHPEQVARHRAMIAATDPEGYASCCEAIAGLDLRAGLPGITAPTLVIGGEQDPAIPASHSRAIAAAIPGARLEILDPGAHLASVERAQTVTSLIAAHISTAGEARR
jgi:3-oxoadipate enol-lactonase